MNIFTKVRKGGEEVHGGGHDDHPNGDEADSDEVFGRAPDSSAESNNLHTAVRVAAILVGLFFWGVSNYFSNLGFSFVEAKESKGISVLIGLVLSLTVTVLQLLVMRSWKNLNPTMKFFGIGSYVYGIPANFFGFLSMRGVSFNDGTFSSDPGGLFLALIFALAVELLPEIFVTWGMGDWISDGITTSFLRTSAGVLAVFLGIVSFYYSVIGLGFRFGKDPMITVLAVGLALGLVVAEFIWAVDDKLSHRLLFFAGFAYLYGIVTNFWGFQSMSQTLQGTSGVIQFIVQGIFSIATEFLPEQMLAWAWVPLAFKGKDIISRFKARATGGLRNYG